MTTVNEIYVKKRDGSLELLNYDKIHRMLEWCSDGLNVSVSDTAIKAEIKIVNKIKTVDIQHTLIKSAAEMISVDTPDYDIFAGRLLVTDMRRQVYGGSGKIPPFLEYITKNVNSGLYSPELLENYTEAEISDFGDFLDYDNNFNRGYASIVQMESKYLIKDSKTDILLEMPQETFMIIPMVIFATEKNRRKLIIEFYTALKNDEISLPTPIISGVRTQLKMFSSCCKIKMGDSTESILSTEYALSLMTSQRAGIGIDMGNVRSILAPVKNNTVKHTGALPILKSIEATSKQFTQNALRSGATVVNYPIFNFEIMDILEYKNNQGSNTTRARFIDYSIGLTSIFIDRVLKKENFTLFSAEEVPDLFEFYGDTDKFDEAYVMYEKKRGIRKEVFPAKEIFDKLVKERVGTGRIYIHFIDNINKQGMFKERITQTNLCVAGDTMISVRYTNALNNIVNETIRIDQLDNITEQEYNNIEVLSYNITNEEDEYRQITAFAQTHKLADVFEIEDEATGQRLVCTGDHMVYTKNNGYVKASDLVESDELHIN
jgi:ribonucleoside-diphosphate reductase alpha chain